MRSIKNLTILILLFSFLLIMCTSSDDDEPEVHETVTIYNSAGEEVNALRGGETAYWKISDLEQRQQYEINILDESDEQLSINLLTSDGNGEIPATAMGYDLGLDYDEQQRVKGIFQGEETYTMEITQVGGTPSTFDFTVDHTVPFIYSAAASGNASNSYIRGSESVYASGKNLTPGTLLHLYIVDDIVNWEFGTNLIDVSGGFEEIMIDEHGEFHELVWLVPNLVAAYDMVADLDRNGYYSEGDLVDGYLPTGFMVQRHHDGRDEIRVQIACDSEGNYKYIFNVDENVFARVNPEIQQLTYRTVHKYLVPHKDIWEDGDELQDVTQGFEMDTPQYGCTNQSTVLIWPSPLTEGAYDVVVDLNRNGTYDVGTDFLDNIDPYNEPTAGLIVTSGESAPVVHITYPTEGLETSSRVLALRGTVSDNSIENARLILNGSTQTIGVDNESLDSTSLILKTGVNTIRVEAYNENGVGFDEVSVNATFEPVGVKITLTWDGSPYNDVDLYVQDPSGHWCMYETLNTAIGGSLDVDDTEGWGPENFYMPKDSANAYPGEYNVKIHYFSDAGSGPTTPTLRILLNEEEPNQVERTIVGPMLSDDEYWYATTITMPAGTFSDYNPPGTPSKKKTPLLKSNK
ncbi:DUF2135 domain-containing protein [bacterium]|nr:DUF2135 domain-containing protein [bacterium]